MDGVRPGGQRRIDRVLDPGYLAGLTQLPIEQVRVLRDEADQEEVDLSYLRRLLQARLDLVQDELERRAEGRPEPADLVAHLARVLADGSRPAAQGLGRHRTAEPSRAGESRRQVEALAGDDLLTGLPRRSSQELLNVAGVLRAEEASVSGRRAAVQQVCDALSAEITRRYRDGEADVDALLPGDAGR